MEKPQARDVFIGILHYIGKNGGIPASQYKTHRALSKLKQKYPELMQEVLFDTNHQSPYSEELDLVQSEFVQSGILNRPNLSSKFLIITAIPPVEELRKIFTKQQLSDLEKLASDFQQEIQS